jgi:hypothetical protein
MTKISACDFQNQQPFPGEIRARVESILDEVTAPSKRRLLRYLVEYPGARTDEIARECAVMYPPCRFHELADVMRKHGLQLRGSVPNPPMINRFGKVTQIYCWHIELVPRASGVAQ